MLSRRQFLYTASASLVCAPLGADAQQAGRMYRIGVLSPDSLPIGVLSRDSLPGLREAFREGLQDYCGYIEGKNIVIEWRDARGRNLAALADELIRLKVDVILTVHTPPASAAEYPDLVLAIPIVMTIADDGRRIDEKPSSFAASVGWPGRRSWEAMVARLKPYGSKPFSARPAARVLIPSTWLFVAQRRPRRRASDEVRVRLLCVSQL
jgi:hypothetical protein